MDIPHILFDKPIQRIKTTCDLMGISDEFERKLPELETHLEALPRARPTKNNWLSTV